MLNLLKEFSNKSRSQYEFEPALESEYGRDVDDLKGMRIRIFADKQTRLTVVVGWRAVLMAVMIPGIYVFAGETMNQWYYLLAGGVLASLFINFFLALLQVLDINAVCSVPTNAQHNENILVKVTLKRRGLLGPFSRYLPLKWLLLRSNLISHLGRSSVVRPMIVETVGDESWVYAATAPLQRGIYRFESMELWSSFPFGLFWWCRTVESVTNEVNATGAVMKPFITVYPRMELVEGNFLYKIRASTDSPMGLSASKSISHAPTSSVRGLREFMHGDSPRLIHWPSSAKSGRLLVREFEAEGLPGFDLLLNMTAPWRTPDQFELAVSIIFSLLHCGYKIGGAPDLYLVPNLDIEPNLFPGFMDEMPALPSGLTRSSHLLARVLPLKDRDAGYQFVDLQESSKIALMTVRPAKLFDANRDENDEALDYQVELAVIPRSMEFGMANKGPTAEVHMPLHEMGFANRRGAGNPTGRVLQTISRIEEIARL